MPCPEPGAEMKSGDKASGETASARHRKAVIPKRRKAATGSRRSSLAAGGEADVALLRRERDEAVEQQRATSEVLRAISNAPIDSTSILGTIAESVARLLNVTDAEIVMRIGGDLLESVAKHGPSPNWPVGTTRPLSRDWVTGRAVIDRTAVHVPDLLIPQHEFPQGAAFARQFGHRTTLAVPLLREGSAIGAILIRRMKVEPFTDRQIELVSSFASQAVIAIENARLFEEVKARTVELAEALEQQMATSEVLEVISSSPGDLQPVFKSMLNNALRICEAKFGQLLLFDGRGFLPAELHNTPAEYAELFKRGPLVPAPNTALGQLIAGKTVIHIPDVMSGMVYAEREPLRIATVELLLARTLLAVPMLKDTELVGAIVIYRQEVRPFSLRQIKLVTSFAAQAVIAIENARLLKELRLRTDELSQSLDDLRSTQDRLVQTQKLASLGQLTAGIAHEIKNPLNFVNNFSGMSAELIGELQGLVSELSIDRQKHADIRELTDMLSGNLEKIVQHGKRADAIVKSMLLHSSQGSGEHRLSDINALVDESLNRAYYGERAETRDFAIKLEKSLDPTVGQVDLFPREITRALLNLISNGFYAAIKRKEAEGSDYEPSLLAATRNLGDHVEIRIRDNGSGIPAELRAKIFDPFFTTKPPGEGTGLGLSITHDIVVKQHGGSIEIDTKVGDFTEVRVTLPRAGALLSEGKRSG